MKVLHHSQEVTVAEGVTCSVKSRKVTVIGPRGTLVKDFRHLKVCLFFDYFKYSKNVLLGRDEVHLGEIHHDREVARIIARQGRCPHRVLPHLQHEQGTYPLVRTR